MNKFDKLDITILYELIKDGSISIPSLSKKFGISASVIYSRIKRLLKKQLIKKFTVIVNDALLGLSVKATIGINRDPKLKETIHQKLIKIPEVISISEVTGRFDIMIVICATNLDMLHNAVLSKIGKIDGIQNTETFIELQKTDKDPTYIMNLS